MNSELYKVAREYADQLIFDEIDPVYRKHLTSMLKALNRKCILMKKIVDYQAIVLQAFESFHKINDWNRPQAPHDIPWLKCSLGHIHLELKKMNFEQIKNEIIDLNADIITICNKLRYYADPAKVDQLRREAWQCEAIDRIDSLLASKKRLTRYTRRIREDINNPDLARLSAL